MKHLLKFENYAKLPVEYYLPKGYVPKTVTINGGNKWQSTLDGGGTNLGPTNEYDGIYTFADGYVGPVYQCGQQEISHGSSDFGPSEDTPTENNGYGLMLLNQDEGAEEADYIEISEVSDNMIDTLPISITISNFTSSDIDVMVPDGTIFYRVTENDDIVYKNGTITTIKFIINEKNNNTDVGTNDNILVTASFNEKFNYIELTPPFVVLLKDSLPMSFEINVEGNVEGNATYTYIGKNNKDEDGNTINGFYVYYDRTNDNYYVGNNRTTLLSGATNITYSGYTLHYYDSEKEEYIYYPDPLTDYVITPEEPK